MFSVTRDNPSSLSPSRPPKFNLAGVTLHLQEDSEPVGNLEFTSFEQSPLVERLHQSYIK